MLAAWQFIFTLLLMFSAGTLIYLSVQGISRLDEQLFEPSAKPGLWRRWASSGAIERIDKALIRFLHRLLRRFKVSLLRADNILTGWLTKTKLKDESNGSAIDFKELMNGQAAAEDISSAESPEPEPEKKG